MLPKISIHLILCFLYNFLLLLSGKLAVQMISWKKLLSMALSGCLCPGVDSIQMFLQSGLRRCTYTSVRFSMSWLALVRTYLYRGFGWCFDHVQSFPRGWSGMRLSGSIGDPFALMSMCLPFKTARRIAGVAAQQEWRKCGQMRARSGQWSNAVNAVTCLVTCLVTWFPAFQRVDALDG